MIEKRIVFPPAVALALVAGLAASPAVRAQSSPGQSTEPAPREEGGAAAKALSLAAPDLASRPDLIEAAKIKPVPPETLERALPAKVAGLSRTESNKTVQPVGPVVLSIVTARYGAAGAARTVEVTVLDPAGLPAIGEIIPVPAAGEAVDYAGRVLRRTEISGFAAAVADGADGLPSLLQVIPGGRIRVTMQGQGVTGKDLVAAASSMDLAKLAR
jgi:hypothetical protein